MKKNILLVLVLLLFNLGYSQTNTWTGATSTAWETATNWSLGVAPLAAHNVVISNAVNQPIISQAGAVCNTVSLSNVTAGTTVSLAVNGSGALAAAAINMNNTGNATSICSLNIGTGTVTTTGNITMAGTAAGNNVTFSGAGILNIGGSMSGGSLAVGTGLVNYNSATAQTVGPYTYNNLTISGGDLKTMTGVTVNGIFSLEGTATTSAAPTYGPAATLQYNSASAVTAGPEWVAVFTASGGVVISNTGVVTLSGFTYTMGDNVPLKINSGASLVIINYTNILVGGDFINNGGSLVTYGNFYITGAGNQSIGGFTAIFDGNNGGVVRLSKPSGIATFTANVNAAFLQLFTAGGTLNLGQGLTHTFTSNWIRTNGNLDGGSSLLKIGGNLTGTGGTFNANTGTVEFNGGNQNLGTGTLAYNNLTLSGTGTKTLTNAATVNNVLSIEGTATTSAAPTYGPAATLQYNSASALTVGPEWVSPFAASQGVVITNTGLVTFGGLAGTKIFNLNVPLTINNGASLTVGSGINLVFGGDFINNGGSLVTIGYIILNGNANQSIGGFTSIRSGNNGGVLRMTKNGGTATLTGNVNADVLFMNTAGGTLNLGNGLTHTFTGEWTRTNGNLDGGSSLLRFGGNVTGTGGAFVPNTGTVEFNGGNQNLGPGTLTYNNLTLSGTGTKTLSATTTVNNVLSIEGTAATSAAPSYGPAATLQYNSASELTVGPEWVTPFAASQGVVIANTGLVTFGGLGANKIFNLNVPLTINNGASLTVGPSINLVFGGDFINNGGSLVTTGNIVLNGNANQSIGSFTSLLDSENGGGLRMAKNGGTATLTGNANANVLYMNTAGGTLNLGTGLTHTFTGYWNRVNGTLDGGSSLLRFGGDVTGTGGAFVPNTGTVEFNGANQNLGPGTLTYNNLTLSGTGTKTLSATTTVNDTFSIAGGVVADLTTNLVHTAKHVVLGGVAQANGSWGSTASTAVNTNNVFFAANNGIINAGATMAATGTLTALTTSYGTASSSTTFNVSGTAIEDAIVVTAPAGFEVSTDNSTFYDTVTVGAAGTVVATPVYVRLKGTIPAADYSGNIVLTSSNTTAVNVPTVLSTVTPLPLTIKAENKPMVYGGTLPVFTVTYSDFVNGDTAASLTTAPLITSDAVQTSGVGTYDIVVSGAVNSNYTFTYVPGVLTITPANLAIALNNETKTYGDANPVPVFIYTGFVNEDTQAVLTALPIATTTAVATSPVGVYPVTIDGATSPNYTIGYKLGVTLTITEASLIITANNQTKVYGEADPVLTVSYSGFVNDETAADLTTLPTISTTAVTTSAAGTYPITAIGAIDTNYIITYFEGTLTITSSTNANLANLTISDGVLNPVFSKDNTSYSAAVGNEVMTVTVTPTAEDELSAITVNGIPVVSGSASNNIVLAVGQNTIVTQVVAADGITVQTYTITITKAASDEAGLADIKVSDGSLSPAFNTATTDYTATVENAVSSITIDPSLIDPTATITINGTTVNNDQSFPVPLNVGDNTITIVVTAQDGTQKTYTIDVFRAGDPDEVVAGNILSPNGDGKNDYWQIKDIDLYPNNSVKVFDRAGRVIYSKNGYNNEWDGFYNGSPLNADTYYYLIDLGSGTVKKGFITIIRD